MIAAFSIVALGLFGFLPQMSGPMHFCLASFALNGKCPSATNALAVGDFHISGLKALSTISIFGLIILALLGIVGAVVLNRLPELSKTTVFKKSNETIPLIKKRLRRWFNLHQKRDPRLNS